MYNVKNRKSIKEIRFYLINNSEEFFRILNCYWHLYGRVALVID